MKKSLITIGILVVVVAAVGVGYYLHANKAKQPSTVGSTAQTNTANQAPQILKPSNLDVRPMLMPLDLPLAQHGTVQVNQYSFNQQTKTMQVEYVYTQKNPATSTVEQAYQQTLKQARWQNIVVNNNTITATLYNYTLQVTFADAGNATTKVSVNYTVNLNNTNEK